MVKQYVAWYLGWFTCNRGMGLSIGSCGGAVHLIDVINDHLSLEKIFNLKETNLE